MPCHLDVIPMQGKEKSQDKNMVQKDLAKLNEFGLMVMEKICAHVLKKKRKLYSKLCSYLTVSCQNSGDATFRDYICVKITQTEKRCATAAKSRDGSQQSMC